MKLFIAVLIVSSFAKASLPSEFISDLENFQSQSWALKKEKAKLESAQDSLISRNLFWTPSLEFSAGKTSTKLNQSETAVDYVGASASLNIFRGGVDSALRKQAEDSLRAQEFSLKTQELSTDLSAADLIFKSVYLKEILRVQEELFKMKEESLKIVRERFNQGKTPLQEVQKTEVDLSQQKSKLRLAALAVQENDVSIKMLFVDKIKTSSWPFTEKDRFKLTSEKETEIKKIPLVQYSYAKLQAAESALKATRRSYWPTLDLSLAYKEYPIDSRDQKQLVSSLVFTLPLWSKYETAASVSAATSNYISALSDFKDEENAAQLKRQFYEKKIEIALENLIEAKTNLEKSKNLYKDLLRSYLLGRISTNDLLIEQNRVLESESNLTSSQLAYHQTVVSACTLLGFRVFYCLQ